MRSKRCTVQNQGISFNPQATPSLPTILSTTRPSFYSALSFASLFNNTTVPVEFLDCLRRNYTFSPQGRGHTLLKTSFEAAPYFFVRISSASTLFLRQLSQDLPPRPGVGFPLSKVFRVSTGCPNSSP